MKAMIMAAGFGTRLRPLTDNIPKALVPVLNRPVLELNIEYLSGCGIGDIIINAHYHSDQIHNFVSACKVPKVNLTVSHEEEILGTGGGIARCRAFLEGDTFMVINSDILTDINLYQALKNHSDSGASATMVLHDCPMFNQIAVTSNNRIEKIHRDTAPERLAFTGIHILEPEIFEFLPDGKEYADIISSCYNPLIESGRPVNACIVSDHYWYDIGTVESYLKASRDFLKKENMEYAKGDNTRIDPSAKIINWAVIGSNVTVGKNAEIDSSIIWDNVVIKKGIHIEDSIVTPDAGIIKVSSMIND